MIRGLRDYLANLGLFGRNIWLFLLAALLMGTGRQIFQVLRNQYLIDLGLRGNEMSSVQGFNSLGGLLIALPAIALIGRFSARSLLMVGAVVNALAFITQAALGGVDIFRSAALTAGLAMGLHMALGAPFMMRNTGVAQRVFAFSLMSTVSWPLSGLIGSLLSRWLVGTGKWLGEGGVLLLGEVVPAHLFGYRFALAIAAGFLLLALIPAFFIREAPREEQGKSIRELLRIHNPRRLFWLGLPEMLIGFGAGLTIPFFNVYFQNEWKLGPEDVSSIFTVMFVVLSISYLLAPPLIKRFGPVGVIVGSQILSLPFFIELALGNALVLAVIAFVMRQTLMNLSDPVYRQFSQEVADPRDRNAVSIVVHTSRQIFFVAANFVSGYLIDAAGGRFTYVIVTTIGLYILAITVELLVLPGLNRVRRYNAIVVERQPAAPVATAS